MRNIIIFISLLCSISPAFSVPVTETTRWDKVFADESITGVFVFCKGNSNSCITNNKVRASTPYIPASTFKIANALIGLETGVIKDEFEVFKWDGKPRAIKQWETDLTLRGAIQVSAVPVFQQIAREIGEKRMQGYLNQFSYGNADIAGGIDRFWLDGQLRISALNQVVFLETLLRNKLPISKLNQYIVKNALITAVTPEYIVYSKTGFSGVGTETAPGIAWMVGWVEKGIDVYFFAFNMDITDPNQSPLRKSIPIKIMVSEGVMVEN